jgi:hypothetical protein
LERNFMGMNMGLRQTQTCSMRPELKMILTPQYEDVGDLELLSLHRIRHRIKTLSAHPDVREKLVLELMRENRRYRETSGKQWYCITPNALDRAMTETRAHIEGITREGISAQDSERIKAALRKVLLGKIDEQDRTIRQWFVDNYDALIYNTQGNIPYPIIQRMRGHLSRWAVEQTNPFDQSIEELVEETVRYVGLDPELYRDHEEMWESLKSVQ